MSVWIPYLRSSPAGRRPGWGSGLRPRSRADGCRLAASKSVCGSVERAADGLGRGPGALKQARDVASGLCGREERRGVTSGSRSSGGAPGSHSITDSCSLARGHPGIDPRRCRPLDPARCDSAPKPSWCATGDLTGLRLALGGTLADEAHGVLVLSGGVARRRRAFRARVARPALWAVLSWLLPPPTARPSRGTSKCRRALCRVSCTIFSIRSWLAVGLGPRPGRTLPTQSTPCSAKPWRRPWTVERDTARRSAISVLATPAVAMRSPLASRTARYRSDGRAAIASRTHHPSADSTNGSAGGCVTSHITITARSNCGYFIRSCRDGPQADSPVALQASCQFCLDC